eukprot:TRINITY_DN3456_c0_g1_i1.p1 TRINITY_DN3456_c0_g1~~TRINITY_DN3456_c0_g1_i1.p1  ORF type:complete len:1078 (-),score=190.94 TRINITY_DN3456_c0_g1_i1:67-2844(-)
MHASISAHSFGTRMLTQFVRLPVPSDKQMDKARRLAQDYEGANASRMLRVPIWEQQFERHLAERDGEDENEAAAAAGQLFADGPMSPVALLEHVQVFRRLQGNWQSYDAYARVCMQLGTNQFLHTLSYFSLTQLIGGHNVPWPALCCVVVFTTCAWVIARLDLYLSRRILAVAAGLLVTPPTLATVCLELVKKETLEDLSRALVPVIYMMHVVWIAFTVCIARAEIFGKVYLPVKFRSVLFLDVFGWLSSLDDVDGACGDGNGAADGCQRLPGVAEGSENLTEDDRAESMAGSSLPSGVRKLLLDDFRSLSEEVRADLARWESPEVAVMRGVEAGGEDDILPRLRAKFDAICAQVPLGARGTRLRTEENCVSTTDDGVWLRMEYYMSHSPMDYFYRCETEETVWEVPAGNVRISDMPTLERQIASLAGQANALALHGSRSMVGEAGSQRGISVGGASENAEASDDDAEGESKRFGGREAVALDPVDAEGDQGSHAFFDNRAFDTTGEGASQERHQGAATTSRRPGVLPWLTVLRGSLVLMATWMGGFCWAVWNLEYHLHETIGALTAADATAPRLAVPLELVAVVPLSHPLASPVGLACDPFVHGTPMLIAERFGLHTLRISPGRPRAAALTPAPAPLRAGRCLGLDGASRMTPSGWPRGAGLSSVTLSCTREAHSVAGTAGATSDATRNCTAMIASADGQSLLACGLAADSSAVPPLHVTTRGNSWRTVSPAAQTVVEDAMGKEHFSARAAATTALWAARGQELTLLTPAVAPISGSAKSNSRLVAESAGPQRLVVAPRFRLHHKASSSLVGLLDLGGLALLGLNSDGTLSAWSLSRTGREKRQVAAVHWRLMPPAHSRPVEWTGGICAAADGALYIAGRLPQERQAAVWRLLPPPTLRDLMHAGGNATEVEAAWIAWATASGR